MAAENRLSDEFKGYFTTIFGDSLKIAESAKDYDDSLNQIKECESCLIIWFGIDELLDDMELLESPKTTAITNSENVFTIVDGGGLNPFRIKVTPTNSSADNAIGTLAVTRKTDAILYGKKNDNVLKIKLKRADTSKGNIEKEFTGDGANSGSNATNLEAFNNQKVYEGDYLEIEFERPDMMYVMGSYHSNSNAKVDYNKGAKDKDNLENVRFYFKRDNSTNESRTGECKTNGYRETQL